MGNALQSDRTEAEVLALAKRLLFIRPLAPYPRRIQEQDWTHRSLASYVREAIWSFYHTRNHQVSIVMPWHRGLKLHVNLGNELGRALFVEGCYDPNEFALLQRILRPGMHVLDVGAHEGIYTTFLARCVGENGRVWSVEPSSRELRHLIRNVKQNHLQNVAVFPLALGETDGEDDLKIAPDKYSGHNTFGRCVPQGTEPARRERVQVRTLDSLASQEGLKRLDAIKIDTEGSEMRVIQGSRGVLRNFRPVILFEAHDESLRDQGTSVRELIGAIEAQGYRVAAFDPDTGLPTAQPGGTGLNLVAFPCEQDVFRAVTPEVGPPQASG